MRRTSTLVLLIVVLLVGFAGCAGCGTYNNLVGQEEMVEESWANVQTAYQRRSDLIPNLVNTVRAAGDFEQETLQAVTEARARATSINVSAEDVRDPAGLAQFQQAQSQLSGALGRLLVVSENYPQLRATEGFRDLQVQLEGTENRINTARTRYNGAVRDYNTAIRRFPAAMFAGMFGHSRRSPFEADSDAQSAPEVDFDS